MQENYRDLFDIPDEVSWLNCAQHSPAMKSVFEAGLAGLELKQHPWRLTSGFYQEIMQGLRQTFARLIGAKGEDIALIPSVSYGITTAAKNLKLGPGKRVLVIEEQFPSNVYPWQMLAAREGGEVLTVKRPKEGGWTKAIEAHLDERVAIVALPNLHWTDGSLIDLEALAPKIHGLGAALVLDLSQSLGVMPLDLEKLRPDYVVSVGYKWLLGPYGCSYFYVAPHRQGGQPIEDSWSGRKGAEDSSSLTNYTDEYLPGALRFDVGEQKDYITLPMAEAALKQILDWGTPRIIETLKPLMGKLADGAEALGLKPPPKEERAPHILGLAFPEAPARDLPSRLAQQGVYVSLRGNTLRVSPHLYNDERDVERFLNALDRFLQRSAA